MVKRRRKARAGKGSTDLEKAIHEGRQRQVYQLGHSWVLGLPRWVRARLGCVEGGPIYLHDEGREEVVLSALPLRQGGRPAGRKLEQDLARAKRLGYVGVQNRGDFPIVGIAQTRRNGRMAVAPSIDSRQAKSAPLTADFTAAT